MITYWERADLLTLLCVMFSVVLSLSLVCIDPCYLPSFFTLKYILQQGISEPVFYDNFVY